jgi:hypothetical protein
VVTDVNTLGVFVYDERQNSGRIRLDQEFAEGQRNNFISQEVRVYMTLPEGEDQSKCLSGKYQRKSTREMLMGTDIRLGIQGDKR